MFNPKLIQFCDLKLASTRGKAMFRSTNLEAQLRALLEQQLEDQIQKIVELQMEQQQIFEKIMKILQKDKDSNIIGKNQFTNIELSGNKHTFKFLPKIEFPIFDEMNTRIWIKKCTWYFGLCKIPN